MSLKYISEHYGVNAQLGGKVIYQWGGRPRPGEIVGSHNASIKVVFDDEPEIAKLYNTTWDMEYVGSEDA